MKKYFLLFLILLFCSCGTHKINENDAINAVKKNLNVSEQIIAKRLGGGFGDTLNFLVLAGQKKYVARFFPGGGRHNEAEIYNFNIASTEGYGPYIYFSDPSQGLIIMEYLPNQKVTLQDLRSKQFYVALAHLLQKIHQGKAFKGRQYNIFKRIDRAIQSCKTKFGNDFLSTKIESIVRIIHQILLPHIITDVPCHNDLTKNNLIFWNNKFKAIDYGDASLGDPFLDLASIIDEVGSNLTPDLEIFFVLTYLRRQPSDQEKAKLYLLKQLVEIRRICATLEHVAPKIVHQFLFIKVPSYREYSKEKLGGNIDMNNTENQLKELKIRLNHIFDNYESKEFKEAINILNKQEPNGIK